MQLNGLLIWMASASAHLGFVLKCRVGVEWLRGRRREAGLGWLGWLGWHESSMAGGLRQPLLYARDLQGIIDGVLIGFEPICL